MTWRTTTDITTDRTASAARGTGAGIIRLGIRGISLLGDIADGTTDGITEAGTVHIITEVTTEAGTTLGTGEALGAGMILGTATIITTAHTIADGTEDGIHTGDITIITATSE